MERTEAGKRDLRCFVKTTKISHSSVEPFIGAISKYIPMYGLVHDPGRVAQYMKMFIESRLDSR
jgi:hypothetical protein